MCRLEIAVRLEMLSQDSRFGYGRWSCVDVVVATP